MEKKNIFENPEAIIITFTNDEIITASGDGPNEEDPDNQWSF